MKKIIIIAIIACFILPQFAFAGAWTLSRNNLWAEWYLSMNWSNKFFDKHANLSSSGTNARTWGWAMAPKLEYGVTDWFTALGGVEYKEGTWKEYSRPFNWGPYVRKNHGLVNANFGGRLRILKAPIVISTQVKAWINTQRGYDINDREPGLSDGADALEIRGLVARKWDTRIPYYLGFESGYRFKNRDVPNDIPLFGEFGFWPWKWLLLKTEIDCYFSHNGTGRPVTDYAIWRIGPAFQMLDLYEILTGKKISGESYMSSVTKTGKAFTIEAQYGNTIWGRNTNGAQEVVIKVSAQF